MEIKMFRKLPIVLSFLSLGLVFTGCSSDDDEQPQTPGTETKGLEPGTDQRPSWQMPNFDNYELTMSVEVQLQDTLQPHASAQDLICATINGEVRGVASPTQVEGVWKFPLVIGSNEGNAAMSLSYYCENLHRIFTTEWTIFDATTEPMGTNGIYLPTFL